VSDPTVSVIIPTYNYGHYISEALDSVFAQTYTDYEVIIVDDGSTDGTPEIVAPYLDRAKFISTDHVGHTNARDVGIAASRGRYICFLDSDDMFTPDKLELQVPFMEAHPEIDFVFSDFSSFDEAGERFDAWVSKQKRFSSVPYRQEGVHRLFEGSLYDAVFYERLVLPGTMLIRRGYLIETGVYDSDVAAKVFYSKFLHTLDKSNVAYTDTATVRRRWHGDNISLDNEVVNVAIVRVFEKFLDARGHEMPGTYRRYAARRMSHAHYRLGRLALKNGEIREGRSHLWCSLKAWPFKWRSYGALAGTLFSKIPRR